MSDLFEKVTNAQDIFKKLASKIPGFSGYIERQNRRAADKLLRIQAHHLLTGVMAVILPSKADLAINEVDQTIVGDGNAMRVATEIFEDVLGAAKRWLGVDHPLGSSYGSQIPGESAGLLKRFKRVKET